MFRSMTLVVLAVLTACAAQTPAPKPAEETTPTPVAEAPKPAPKAAEEEPRDTVYVWDLTDLYPSEDAWNAAREDILKRVAELPRHKGTLGKSARHMHDVAEEFWSVNKDLSRMFIYASLSRDEDQRIAEAQSRYELARAASAEFSKATSWVSPELLAMGQKKIERFIKAEPGLKPYVFFLRDTVRLEPHTLDAAGEGLLASASLV
ncbi:MAG: hypothetical protein AAFX94_11170, partial [Myxococcota bacterium]